MSGQKNYCRIWITSGEGFAIAVDRYVKRFINFVIGDRSNKTAKQLWKEIEHCKMNTIASDYRKAYEEIVPKEKHIRSKSETFTAEGYNRLFRHFLARMRRKNDHHIQTSRSHPLCLSFCFCISCICSRKACRFCFL